MTDWSQVGFWAKNIVGGLVLLPTGPMLAMAFGYAMRRRRWGRVLIGLGMTTLFVFSLPIVSNTIAWADERTYPPLDPSVAFPPRSAIVVLSGGAQLGATDYDGETINGITLARLRSAAHLAARTKLPILVSGGRLPDATRAEADMMAEVLEHDFATPVRWIENRSLDTDDNARLSTTILKEAGVDTAIVVTDVSHMRRAHVAFDAARMPTILAPTDYYANGPVSPLSFIPNANALRRANWSLHEWLGVWWMRLRHGTDR